MNVLTNVFIRLGWSRDDRKWLVAQIVSAATLITSNAINLAYWFAYLGIPISEVAIHRILVLATIILWLAGRYATSNLPSQATMASGSVPGSPASGAGYSKPNNPNTSTHLLLILVLAGGLGLAPFTLVGCAANRMPPTIVTPQGQAAYRADQVVQRLQQFADAVKADTGTQPGNIRPRDAFTIIEWISGDAHGNPPTTGLVQIIAASPDQTWKADALQTWTTRIKPLLSAYPSLATWVSIVDALLQVVS